MSAKICTFNTKGLGEYKKRMQIFEYLKSNNFAICLLQELHCERTTYNVWEKQWGNEAFFPVIVKIVWEWVSYLIPILLTRL